MRLRRRFVIIASALCAGVLVLVTGTVLHGQSGWSTFSWDEPHASAGQATMRPLLATQIGGGGRLGVTVTDLSAEDVARLKLASPHGARIEQVQQDSPASKAGLEAGDVVVQFDGENVRSMQQFTRLVRETPAGRTVKLGVMRDGKRIDAEATLAEAGPAMSWEGSLVRPEIRTPDTEAFKQGLDALRERMPDLAQRLPDLAQRMPKENLFYFNTPRGPFRYFGLAGRGRLGVSVQELTPELSEFFGVKDGVLVASVSADSPASKAGIKAGDVITKLNDKAVASGDDLVSALSDKEGDVTITVVRDKKSLNLKAALQGNAQKRKAPVLKSPA